jgi:hypothetical protein
MDQLCSFHWAPAPQLPTFKLFVDKKRDEAKKHRDEIQALADDDSDEGQQRKRRLLCMARMELDSLRLGADACVGAFFSTDKPKLRELER